VLEAEDHKAVDKALEPTLKFGDFDVISIK